VPVGLAYPERIELARAPTPLQPLQRSSEALGVDIWIKRDDLTGAELSGNKVRKLEFLLAEAVARGADTVITGGGEQSNHCRATALAATRLGLRSRLLLRTADPARPPAATGNILLDRLAGAELRWITRGEWARRAEMFADEADKVTRTGGTPYVIPEGGSNAVGAWGYVRAAEELAGDLDALPPARRTTIVFATGSGGTAAGLLLGAKLLGFAGRGVTIASVNVSDDREYFVATIGAICRDFDARFDAGAGVAEADIEIVDGYVGRGYARSRPEELAAIRDLARRDAVILDPVYTGKAWYGIVQELACDRDRFGDRIVFVHTGGIFGLFPIAAELAPLL
jgi:D-cysteine desulfhydrase